ncbi:MAG: transglutaminase domain-containing protein [Xanthomonadales bacterium]|nr:transglutaminase domain-containing protein [Xanthomonadales bacterium]
MVDAGQFSLASRAIRGALAAAGIDENIRRDYQWQQERMRRIRSDFSLDQAQASERLAQQLPDLEAEDVTRWTASGDLESMVIDGERRYFRRGIGNLFLLNESARARRNKTTATPGSPLESAHPHHREVLEAVAESGNPSVLPRRFRITQHLSVDADSVPDGETLRAWIPYPQELMGQQEGIRFVSSQPGTHRIAPAGTAQRSVYLERAAEKGKPTEFSITYELTIFARHMAVDPTRVETVSITRELAPFIAERPPHIVFTRALRVFSQQVVGDETDPWRIAQKLYAAVDRIPWAGAREYSTISNLSDYTLHAGHGDCGQQTLLLMTLLRLNGIPARWQSGAMFSPGDYWNIHDWGWLYIAPYGWLPMDVTFGRLDSDDADVADFYLGGLDGYRIAFNSDYSRPLTPAKQHFRSDNVDSQRGEVEWRGGNLYYDQWNYDFEWHVLPDAGAPDQNTRSTSLHR